MKHTDTLLIRLLCVRCFVFALRIHLVCEVHAYFSQYITKQYIGECRPSLTSNNFTYCWCVDIPSKFSYEKEKFEALFLSTTTYTKQHKTDEKLLYWIAISCGALNIWFTKLSGGRINALHRTNENVVCVCAKKKIKPQHTVKLYFLLCPFAFRTLWQQPFIWKWTLPLCCAHSKYYKQTIFTVTAVCLLCSPHLTVRCA